MISIIITSYNYGEYISNAIKSVLAQTFSDWELIVVDDASSDNSVEIIKEFQAQDDRIKLVCHNENKGLQEAVKTGLNLAKGEWVAFLESDDFWEENTLEERVKVCDLASVIFNSVKLTGDKDWIEVVKSQIEKNEKKLSKEIFPKNMFKDFMVKNPVLTFSCVMFKRDILSESFFNAPVDKLFDWWFYIHIAYNNKFYYLDKKLTNWRLHSSSYIKKNKKRHFKIVNAMAYFNVYKQRKNLNVLYIAILCYIEMCFIRLRVYFISFIRRVKRIIGLETKKSPLFD